MMRSIPLRGFDQQMAGHIKTYMEETAKIKFLEGAVPTAVELTDGGRKKVTWQLKDGTTASDEYDTVLLAIGLDAAGVKVNPRSGKVPVSSTEQTNVPHIYALGDIIDGEAPARVAALRRRLRGQDGLWPRAHHRVHADRVRQLRPRRGGRDRQARREERRGVPLVLQAARVDRPPPRRQRVLREDHLRPHR